MPTNVRAPAFVIRPLIVTGQLELRVCKFRVVPVPKEMLRVEGILKELLLLPGEKDNVELPPTKILLLTFPRLLSWLMVKVPKFKLILPL